MRYLCAHCDEQFEQAAGDKPRCPKCMRVGSVRELAQTEVRRPRPWKLAVAVLTLAVAAGGVHLWTTRDALPDAQVLEREPLSRRVLEAELERRQIDAKGLTGILVASDAVEAFAEQHAGSGTPEQRAQAIAAALRARGDAKGFLRGTFDEPRPGDVMMPDAVLSAIAKDGARARVYPLELSAFAVAALRSVGVDAMLAEVYGGSIAGEGGAEATRLSRPLDPSGKLGYYAVALPQAGETPARVFDVFWHAPLSFPSDHVQVLSDLGAVGVALATRALGTLADNGEPAAALRDIDAALKLCKVSATLRGARGAVLLASGGESEGRAELEAAMQMRPDGPQRHTMAMVALATGQMEEASKQIALALEQFPEFAAAHATLATIHMANRELDQARAELQKAESIDPDLSSMLAAWAQLHLAQREMPQALARASRAVELHPQAPQAHLLLGTVLRAAGRYDDMRRHARTALELVPASQKERTRMVIGQLLGPTALEVPEDEQAASAALAAPDAGVALPEPEEAAPGGFDLSAGSSLLGGEHDDGPSLLGKDRPLNLGGGAPKLRLGGSGGGLKLDP